MQSAHLQLKEIIWEITGECHNNCSYCGSKKTNDKKSSDEIILKIADKIAAYPPKEINISGGDPLTVSENIHDEILKKFKNKDIICKIIVNTKSFKGNAEKRNIIEKYDWAGVSINSKKDVELMGFEYLSKYTVITNFNVANLYDFDTIEDYVIKHKKFWTIQHTMYNDPNNLLAIYHDENKSAFETLQNKIFNSKAKIILSDNVNGEIGCGAGLCSLGITYEGKVIPCLSMRSWEENIEEDFVSNSILENDLEEIWINDFNEQRFGCFKCCKDACNNKYLSIEESEVTKEKKSMLDIIDGLIKTNPSPNINDFNRTLVYGTFMPDNIQVVSYQRINSLACDSRISRIVEPKADKQTNK